MKGMVRKCFYHKERFAVATCIMCGAAICMDCSVKDNHGRTICIFCGNNILKQEHKEHRKMLKARGGRFCRGTDFIIPSIIGILIVLGTATLYYFFSDYRVNTMLDQQLESIPALIMVAYMLFSIPFGVIMLNDIFAPKYDTRYGHFSKTYFKIFGALFCGWIIFSFYLIRFIIVKISNKVKKRNTDN